MRPLSKATEGDDYTISWLMGLPETINYLKRADVCEGSVLHVIANFADAVLISCGGRRFILENEAARRIQVTPCME